MRDIGKNIKDLRISRNLTQDQLAEKLFVTRQTVSNYENGKSRPDVDMIIKLGEVLECDVNAILYGVKDNGRKTEYIKLAVGAVLTIFITALYLYLAPIAIKLKGLHYLSSFHFLIRFTLTPLAWLIGGWTAMQLTSIVFKTRKTLPKWVKYIRYILLTIIVIYFVLTLLALLPTTIDDLIYYTDKTTISYSAYKVYFSECFVPLRTWVIDRILYPLVLPVDIRTVAFLIFGILLWLCGFPQSKKHGRSDDVQTAKQDL